MEVFIIIWLALCVFVGVIGNERKIGFFGAFIISIILSPLLGFIITIFSKSLIKEKKEEEFFEQQNAQTNLLKEKVTEHSFTLTDEIQKLYNLKENGLLTEDEFTQAKQNLINKI